VKLGNPKVQLRSNATILLFLKLTRTKPLPMQRPVSDAAIASDSVRDFSWLEGVCGREKMARCLAGEQPHTIWALARADRQEFRRAE
jgi:hypothetical protein